MSERSFFEAALRIWLALAVLVFPVLFVITAPYGRHLSGNLRSLPRTLGWVLMESPSALGMPLLFLLAGDRSSAGLPSLLLLVLWEVHYLNRSFVFPFRMRGGQARIPLRIVGSALVFNLLNVYFNGRWLTVLGPGYPPSWLRDPRFLLGTALFLAGLALNLHSDAILRGLRPRGEGEYRLPRGGMFRLVSCPNYLGEIVEWSGWALATWSLPGAAFAIWTVANLVPRARSHHRWYRERFGAAYPAERRAVLPWLL